MHNDDISTTDKILILDDFLNFRILSPEPSRSQVVTEAAHYQPAVPTVTALVKLKNFDFF